MMPRISTLSRNRAKYSWYICVYASLWAIQPHIGRSEPSEADIGVSMGSLTVPVASLLWKVPKARL